MSVSAYADWALRVEHFREVLLLVCFYPVMIAIPCSVCV